MAKPTFTSHVRRPLFDELPLGKDDPPFSAWGLYGKDDQLGTLNLLTSEIVVEAAKEVKNGMRIGLDLPLNYLTRVPFGRGEVKHSITADPNLPFHDDEISMNTQVSTQWDGFRHCGYLSRKVFYNGTTRDQIVGPNSTNHLGIHNFCAQGIVGRGVLIDYLSWMESKNEVYDLLGDHAIAATNLRACANAQGVTFKKGDILFVRTGFTVAYNSLSQDERVKWSLTDPPVSVGVEATADTARWIWDQGFSACASDAPGWERFPIFEPGVNRDGEKQVIDHAGLGRLTLHEIMLSGWGMPIGELFDLELLSKECIAQRRYTFFITSMPLNIPGGVGSPTSTVAIF